MSVRAAITPLQDQKHKGNAEVFNNMKAVVQKSSVSKEKPTGELVALDKMKMSSTSSTKVLDAKYGSQFKKVSPPDGGIDYLGNPCSKGNLFRKPEVKSASFPENSNVILLSDDEGEELTAKPTEKALGTPKKDNKEQERVVSRRNNMASTNLTNSVSLMNVDITTSECRQVVDASPNENFEPSQQDLVSKGTSSANTDVDKSIERFSSQIENPECNLPNTNDPFLHPQPCNGEMASNEDGQIKLETDANSRSLDNLQNASGNASGSQNNLDKYFWQRGPRIAKVIRRINCNVEPLEYGTVSIGKLWCDSRAIYPKGFKSRVKYINVLDPTNMCYYVSEILDVGKDLPLFMVSLEDSLSEVFVHISAPRCWEMVRERVNQEIAKQHKLGIPKLPPLQPHGSLDGMEMFGFSSPAICSGYSGNGPEESVY